MPFASFHKNFILYNGYIWFFIKSTNTQINLEAILDVNTKQTKNKKI